MSKHRVYVNRILNMKKIKLIGLDMDHTLIRYQSEHFESLVYRLAQEQLVKVKHYPQQIKQLNFNYHDAIRGLVIDSKNGNILKLSRYGAIRQSYHGTQLIDYAEQQKIYRSIYIDLGDPNYMVIDTSFSIAFCVLYGQLVHIKDTMYPNEMPSYQTMAQDVQFSVDTMHSDGSLKTIIRQNLSTYVIKEPAVAEGLQHLTQHGKKIFLLTNSDYSYAKILLEYALDPFLKKGETWLNLFEFVITLANKPRFFYDNLRFLSVNPANGSLNNTIGPIVPGIYQGGNAKKFAEDLHLRGDEILYIGDHIYDDILRLKKACNWRTALVVEELGEEIAAQARAMPIEIEIKKAMKIKKVLEERCVNLNTKSIDEDSKQYSQEIHELHVQIHQVDAQLTQLLKQQHAYFNPKWERIFRAGAEESYFAYQVDRFACIYMEKLSDLFEYSPMTYFRANRRPLAHDV